MRAFACGQMCRASGRICIPFLSSPPIFGLFWSLGAFQGLVGQLSSPLMSVLCVRLFVSEQLPEDSKRFEGIDRIFRSMMEKAKDVTNGLHIRRTISVRRLCVLTRPLCP